MGWGRRLAGLVIPAGIVLSPLGVLVWQQETRPDYAARYQFNLPPAKAESAVRALAGAPLPTLPGQPLPALRIAQPAPATLTVAPAGTAGGPALRFTWNPISENGQTLVNLELETGTAAELDLGPGRLVNRTTLTEAANEALGDYASAVNGYGSRAAALAAFGRVLGQMAVLADPAARTRAAQLARGPSPALDRLFGARPSDDGFDDSAEQPFDPSPRGMAPGW